MNDVRQTFFYSEIGFTQFYRLQGGLRDANPTFETVKNGSRGDRSHDKSGYGHLERRIERIVA